jgi:hypothetical protein
MMAWTKALATRVAVCLSSKANTSVAEVFFSSCVKVQPPFGNGLQTSVVLSIELPERDFREAFPFDQLPRYMLRDRNAIFGADFRTQVTNLGIHEVLSAPRSPWQRAYVERVIGSIRRECLDHVIVFNGTSLRRILVRISSIITAAEPISPWERTRPSTIHPAAPKMGRVVALPQVGGLHHRYERRAA